MSNLRLLVAGLLAVGALTACKGSGSSSSPSGPTAQLRIVQGNPALQAVDYKVDQNGTLNTNAQPGVVQPYMNVSAGTPHTIYFYEASTNGNVPANPNANCGPYTFASNAHYSLVIVNPSIGSGGTSATGCVLYQEPSVTAVAGQGVVVYHNVAGNPTIKDANGNPTATLYPIFCQAPANGSGPCGPPFTTPSGVSVTNGAAGGTPTAVRAPVRSPSAGARGAASACATVRPRAGAAARVSVGEPIRCTSFQCLL